MLGWFDAQGYRPRLADTSVAELAQIYLEEGAAEGVRGDFAFAQAVVETGGFSAAATTTTRGSAGATPAPAAPCSRRPATASAPRSSCCSTTPTPARGRPTCTTRRRRTGGDPNAADAFDHYFAKGWAPTWRDMGHGNWATDPNYAGKVIGVYDAMVKFSQGG